MEQKLAEALADRYTIEREIGAGGMGTVYLARELKHDRQVAIKVLRPEIASHLGVVRFLNEVKVTARLDHPHILTLIDSGESDEFLWYVQPFVRGESLRAKLDREHQLSIEESVAIARQVASALHHAHQKGVIHRDIKPANILLHEGEAMVADFGIALAVTEAADSRMTATGIAIGTPQYMSPEQATGERHIDGRSDQYSLAAVLYEMLSGVTPHTAPTTQALIAKLLTERPTRVRTVRSSVPPNIDAAVAKALEMTPADRFGSAAEFGAALQYTPSGGFPAAEAPRRSRAILIGTIAGVVVLAGAGAAVMLRPSGPALTVGRSEQITADPGLEIQPALSPDGKLVAYAAGTATHMRILLRPVGSGGGGRTIPLTDDSTAVETQPRWAPDGSRILYLTHGGASVAAALGGASRPVVAPSATSIVKSAVWSPDGREIAFVRGDTLSAMPIDGGTARMIATGTDLHSCNWAPNGRSIACVSLNSQSVLPGPLFGNLAPSGIVLFPVKGGNPVRIAEPTGFNQSPTFSGDSRRLFFLSSRDGPRDVYVLSLSSSGQPRGTPVRLTTGLGAKTISVSSDTKLMAYAMYAARGNIWSAPIPANPPPAGVALNASNATAVTRGSQVIQGIRVSPDGRWLMYDSDLHGNSDIYRVPINGGPVEQLTSDSVDKFAPDLSPDGTAIVYHSFRTGTRDIEVKPLNGGPIEQLTNTPGQESYAKWSPDGHAVLFYDQSGPRNALLMRRGPDGRWTPPEVLASGTYRPQWSPDGKSISYVAAPADGEPGTLMIMPATGGPAHAVFTPGEGAPAISHAIWSPDGRTLYCKVHDARGFTSFWSVSAQGGRPRLLLRMDDPAW
ncbi:MAG TPA: protein kinase, partial [Gemmatimonadales bacterium]|nr:protein kinase [Gemmatimonadales bacterium]